jgi:hypothetical protein
MFAGHAGIVNNIQLPIPSFFIPCSVHPSDANRGDSGPLFSVQNTEVPSL